ncbi:hypothetical protein DSL92_08555 [Billgrantia gudaonensis]|uniref:Cytochrome c-type biogenesis protein CcmF C-terminal domain-containing protein n=1 Tax=Billgrantia gudaonensis TaxID=376427 RepID=A0A3S0QFH1_9GAMM|nr:hypothetical protein DSL92_08555 [Halomonas gudaonensis]
MAGVRRVRNVWVALGLVTALWIVPAAGARPVRQDAMHPLGWPVLLSLAHWGMVLGHLPGGDHRVGVAVVSNFAIERNVRMAPGDSVSVAGYTFTMKELTSRRGPNYIGDGAEFEVRRGDSRRSFTHESRKAHLHRSWYADEPGGTASGASVTFLPGHGRGPATAAGPCVCSTSPSCAGCGWGLC